MVKRGFQAYDLNHFYLYLSLTHHDVNTRQDFNTSVSSTFSHESLASLRSYDSQYTADFPFDTETCSLLKLLVVIIFSPMIYTLHTTDGLSIKENKPVAQRTDHVYGI